ncbi:MAG TPA: hypothetical protein VFF39_15115 [Verrucomicrobiae bacterium]|nr:hypothetical protein [Verrucomicrobiae bacterium]
MLTKTEAECWLPRAGLERDKNGDLGYRNGSNLRVIVPLPDKPYRLPYLANLVLTAYMKPFVESLVWFTGWGAGGEVSNPVGFTIVQSLRGDSRPLIEAPAHLCQTTQQVEAQSLLVVAMLMGWDAYFIPASQRYFVFNSNDEFIDVVSNDAKTHERFLTVLAADWNGREG